MGRNNVAIPSSSPMLIILHYIINMISSTHNIHHNSDLCIASLYPLNTSNSILQFLFDRTPLNHNPFPICYSSSCSDHSRVSLRIHSYSHNHGHPLHSPPEGGSNLCQYITSWTATQGCRAPASAHLQWQPWHQHTFFRCQDQWFSPDSKEWWWWGSTGRPDTHTAGQTQCPNHHRPRTESLHSEVGWLEKI